MKIELVVGDIIRHKADLVVVNLFEGVKKPGGATGAVDKAVGGAISAAIKDDVVYISDLSGFLYALNAQTGEHYWTYDVFAAVWGSPFVADGKVYLGDEDGDVVVLKEGKGTDGEADILAEDQNFGAAVYTTPVAHEGTLFVLARNRLFALEQGAQMKMQ